MTIQPTLSRLEYVALLQEAYDEGRVCRTLGSAIETKEYWAIQTFWTQYSSELQSEFYRAGYTHKDRNKGE